MQSVTCLKMEKHNLKLKKILLLYTYHFHMPRKLKKLYSGTLKKRELTSNQNDVKACRYFQRHDRAKSPDEIPSNDRISDCVGQFFAPVSFLGVSNLS